MIPVHNNSNNSSTVDYGIRAWLIIVWLLPYLAVLFIRRWPPSCVCCAYGGDCERARVRRRLLSPHCPLSPLSSLNPTRGHLLVAALRRPLCFLLMRLIVVVVLVVEVVVSISVSAKQLFGVRFRQLHCVRVAAVHRHGLALLIFRCREWEGLFRMRVHRRREWALLLLRHVRLGLGLFRMRRRRRRRRQRRQRRGGGGGGGRNRRWTMTRREVVEWNPNHRRRRDGGFDLVEKPDESMRLHVTLVVMEPRVPQPEGVRQRPEHRVPGSPPLPFHTTAFFFKPSFVSFIIQRLQKRNIYICIYIYIYIYIYIFFFFSFFIL